MRYTSVIKVLGCLLITFSTLVSASATADILGQLISSAITSHPSVQSHQALGRAANAGVDTARWQFYPTPSLSVETAGASSNDSAYQGDDYVATLGLQQPLWTGGKLTAGLEKAKANVVDSEAAIHEARDDVALRVVQAYGDWFAAFLKRQAMESSLQTHGRLRGQVSRRVDNGFSSKSDLSLAEGRLESTRADLESVIVQESMALSTLKQLVGDELGAEALDIAGASTRPVAGNLPKLIEQAQQSSPGLKRALSQVSVAEARIAERKADNLPDVYLRVERQYGSLTTPGMDPENRIFIGMNSNFGPGLSNVSGVDEMRARRDAARSEVLDKRRLLSDQVTRDYAMVASFKVRINALERALKTAESVTASYGRQFLSGKKTWLDVMNSARDLVAADTQLSDARAAYLVVTWRLAITTDGLDETLSKAQTEQGVNNHLASKTTDSDRRTQSESNEFHQEILKDHVVSGFSPENMTRLIAFRFRSDQVINVLDLSKTDDLRLLHRGSPKVAKARAQALKLSIH